MTGYDGFIFRDVEPIRRTYRATPAVQGLVQRGDEAMWSDDWDSAESCYIAAHFLCGGRDEVTKIKIEMVKQILHVQATVRDANARVESARHTRSVLTTVLEDIELALDSLLSLRMELPYSESLMDMEGSLDRVLRQGQLMQIVQKR